MTAPSSTKAVVRNQRLLLVGSNSRRFDYDTYCVLPTHPWNDYDPRLRPSPRGARPKTGASAVLVKFPNHVYRFHRVAPGKIPLQAWVVRRHANRLSCKRNHCLLGFGSDFNLMVMNSNWFPIRTD